VFEGRVGGAAAGMHGVQVALTTGNPPEGVEGLTSQVAGKVGLEGLEGVSHLDTEEFHFTGDIIRRQLRKGLALGLGKVSPVRAAGT